MRPTTGATRDHEAELEWIRAEFKRRGQVLPDGLYGWERPVNLFFQSQRIRSCVRALVREGMFPLDARSVLDVGCGSGQQLAEFLQWGRGCSLHGIDLVEDRILAARARLASADLCVGDACRLPWPNATFDVVTQFTVFTSVRDKDMKRQIASEMLRVSKPDGLILWCDFRYNNPRNSNVRGIEAKEIRSLFPGCVVKLEKIGLAPPLARAVVPVSWIAALMLEKAPFLRTQYLGTIRRTAPLGRTYDEGERRPQFGTPRPNDLSSLPPTLD